MAVRREVMATASRSRVTGIVCSIDPGRRFGFIRSDDFEREIFFSLLDLGASASALQVGSSLRGRVVHSPKGPRLEDIQVLRIKRSSPSLIYGLLSLLAVAALAVGIQLQFPVTALTAYVVAVNLAALFFMGLDKSLARAASLRTPEVVLFILALLGGSAGILLGVHVFRHKTRKAAFQFVLFLIFLAQGALLRALKVSFWEQ